MGRSSSATSTAVVKVFLIFVVNIVALYSIMCCVRGSMRSGVDFRPLTYKERKKMSNLRSELNRRIYRSRDAIESQFQREYMTEERDRLYVGTSKSVGNHHDIKSFKIRFHSRIHSGLLGIRGSQKGLNFWVTKIEFPTTEPDTCLKFRYEDLSHQVYDATFKEGCNQIYNMILHWMTSTRMSKIAIKDQDIPVPHDGMKYFGLVLSANNPAHVGLWFWDATSKILDPSLKYAISEWNYIKNDNSKNRYDTIEGTVVDHDFNTHKFSFQIWLKRNRLISKEMRKFLDHQARSFLVHRVVPVEGAEVDLADLQNLMTIMAMEDSIDFIVENGKSKSITVGGHTISNKSNWESMVDVKFFANKEICMTMKVETENGPQYYHSQDSCPQLFVEIQRIQKEK